MIYLKSEGICKRKIGQGFRGNYFAGGGGMRTREQAGVKDSGGFLDGHIQKNLGLFHFLFQSTDYFRNVLLG